MSDVRRNKHLLFQAISVMGKAFASPVRLELLDLLAQAPRTVEALAKRFAELAGARGIVAYCRGPFCAFAHEAVRKLTQAGHAARRLEEGWPEWRLASEPAEPTPV